MHRMPFAILLLVSGAAFAGTMYKWVDVNGTIHYSDRPRPGATELQIDTRVPTGTPPPVARVPVSTASTEPAEEFRYEDCSIVRPANDETLQNAYSMSVGWQIRPGLRSGDRVTLALDGTLVAGVSPSGTSFTITPVDRGTHTLMVSILDANGRGLCQSAPVTVHVRQPTLYSPARRPVPTPRPAPRPSTPRS